MGSICANTAYAQAELQQQCEAKATEKNLIGDIKADYIKACVKTLIVADKAGQCEQAATDKTQRRSQDKLHRKMLKRQA
ncbi:hypothetical protein PCI56_02180 [Plesiomonas shigelloides subsp. oncorhynchi]|nr:hypothetical protein [Plesiomonas shigelloides]